MAINYTDLFDDIGELYSAIVEVETMMDTVQSRWDAVITQYTSSGVTNLISDVNQKFGTCIQQLENTTNQLIGVISNRLRDRETVLEQLPNLTSTNITSVIFELIADMKRNSKTVKKSVVGLTPGSSTTSNTDVGQLIVSALLPGNVAPGRRFQQNRNLAGVLSELPLADQIQVICTDDSQSGGSIGDETFVVTGIMPEQGSRFAANQGGNVGRTTLNINNENIVTNFFEEFTQPDIPDDWEVIDGEVVTDFSMGLTDPLLGEHDLVFTAGGAATLRYDIFESLIPDQVMCIFMWIKRPGSAGTGTFDVQVNINGVDVVDEDTLPNSATYNSNEYVLWSFPFVVPSNLGSSAYVELVFSNSVSIRVDGGGLCPMQSHAGIQMLMVQGQNPFLIDDVFPLAVTNTEAGKLQRLFTRAFGFQLPSATSGSENISDP